MRLALVMMLAAGTTIAGCTSSTAPPTPEPTATAAPLGAVWATCDDAALDAFSADLDGRLLLAPDDSLADQELADPVTYPEWLPAPSCIDYPTGQALSVAFFVGATEADVAAFEQLIVEWEGDRPTPVDGIEAPVLVAETWPMGPVIDLRYIVGGAVSEPYLQITSVFSATGEGG